MKTFKTLSCEDVAFARSVFIALIQSGQIKMTEIDLSQEDPLAAREKLDWVFRRAFPVFESSLAVIDEENTVALDVEREVEGR